jgi:CRISPR-associated endonuclease/helicase Cas3
LFDPQNWQRVIAEAKAGRMVLICVNTVRRAQEAFRRLRAELPEAKVLLLHSRFNMRDRSERESFIRRHAGLHAQRAPLILVATQVVEVSLDIDFDVIFSDPAPLEALVQRFGRVNRRGRIRPAAPVYVFTEPVNDRRPYPDDLIRAALGVLKDADDAPIREDQVGAWLDKIYTDQIEARWQKAYRQAQQEFIKACVHKLRPFQSDPGIEESFYRAFDGLEVLPLSLKQEYKDAMNQNPILAQELLVPIRYRQFYQLKNSGRVSFFGSLPVVNLPYDPNVGLDMSLQDADSVDAD